MKTSLQVLFVSLIGLCSLTLHAQVYQIQRSGPEQVCGTATGTINMVSSANVTRWEVGTFNGTFTVETTIETSNSSYDYTVTAPGMKAFRAYCQGASGFAYTNVVIVRANEAVDAGTISGTTNPIEHQGSGSGTLTVSGLVGTARWQMRPAGSSTWENSPSGGSYTGLTRTTDFKVYVANADYSCTDESNIITVTVYNTGVLTGPSSVIEGSIASFSLTGSSGLIERWEFSEDGGTSWNHIPSKGTGYGHMISQPIKVRVLVNQGTVSPSLYSNTVDVAMVPYSPNDVVITGENYIREHTVLLKGVTDVNAVDNLAVGQSLRATAYQDGFGRTVQQNAQAASPLQKDLIQPVLHDYAGGKEATQYLPYVSSAANGTYATTAFQDQLSFYNNGAADKVADDLSPFAKTIFEKSPLRWILQQGSPGAAWQPGSGHTTDMTYGTNDTGEVRLFLSDGSSSSFFDQNELTRLQQADPDGKKTQVFRDKSGRTILTRVQLDETFDGVIVPWLETYYIYNDRGEIRYIISPKGVATLKSSGWAFTPSIKNQYVTEFVYDALGRPVEKKVPGQAVIYFCYDRLDRLVLQQDGNLRASNQWSFIKYDRKGRPVMQGVYTNTTHTTRTAVQLNVVDNLYQVTTDKYYEERGTALHGYTNQSFPGSDMEVLSVQYYDTYDFNADGTNDFAYTAQSLANEGQPGNSIGLLTGNKKVVMGSATWLYNYIFYDAFGRPIQVRSNNHLSATIDNLTTNVYNFAGALVLQKTYHYAVAGAAITVNKRMTYDHAGRIKQIYQRNNSDAEVLVAHYSYNELGQLVDKGLHCTSCDPLPPSPAFLQSVDYRYDIRGALTSINNSQLVNDAVTNDETNDYFGMEFLYGTVESGLNNNPQYNGNVSAVKWKMAGGGTGADNQNSYSYSYDKANRLLSAASKMFASGTWTKEAGSLNESIAYDLNGNITSLQRNMRKHELTVVNNLPVIAYGQEQMDDLTYTYNASMGDQLKRVTDASGKAGGFDNGTSGAIDDYTYDENGNLLTDRNKGITTNIVYNLFGKPTTINFTDGRKIEYVYDASGTKLTMKTFSAGGVLQRTTDYMDGFVYENNTLSFFSQPEGRVVKKGSTLEYQYGIADHQGNTRVVFSSVAPTPDIYTATFEDPVADNLEFDNVPTTSPHWASYTNANNTPGGIKVVRLNQNTPTGPAKSLKVFPGDKVDMEVWTHFQNASGFGTTSPPLAAFIANVAGAFGGVSGGAGESGAIYNGVDEALGSFGTGGSQGDNAPGAYLNYILFDVGYNVLDAGWTVVPVSALNTKQKISIPTVDVKEAGYIFVYLSYEAESNNYVEFDDFKVTHTKTNIIQYNEYYPFGLRANTSWTREDSRNDFLYNAGSELNATSGWYETFFRDYDPALGRFVQVDPLAAKYASLSSYHFGFNNPVMFSDPSGAEGIQPGPPDDLTEMSMAAWIANSRPGGPTSVDIFAAQSAAEMQAIKSRNQSGGMGFTSTEQVEAYVGLLLQGAHGHGQYVYEDDGIYYGGTYHTENGIITSMSISEVNQADNGGWYGVGATSIIEFGTQQGNYSVLQAEFGFGEGLGSLELALAGLKPTFDGAAYMARLQGGGGEVPLFLKKNIFKSYLSRGNNALYVGRVSSTTAIRTAGTLGKVAPALGALGVATNVYDIVKDGQLTAGDGFQAINTGLMVAFPVYGVIYGVVDLGFAVFSDQSLTDRIKSGIDSNVSGGYALPWGH